MNHYRVCESTHTCRGAHTASCHVCSVSLWHQSLTLLCLLSSCYLPPGLSDLSFSFSFLPSFLSFLSQLFSFLSNISASYLFFALLLRVSLLCPVVSFLPSFFLLFSCPSSLIFFLSFFHLFFLPHPSLPSFLMPLFTSFFHCILLALLPSSLFL